ncbi:MAG: DsbA family oxidoreductase [Pseudomonadales bacterium]
MMKQSVHVDIVSDIVCPWCIIGYRQFEQAFNKLKEQLTVSIHWQPFQLNPAMPLSGESMLERNAAKYGSPLVDLACQKSSVIQLGSSLGITFNYHDEMRVYNTLYAHQLLHWAGKRGRQTELKIALLEAYFTHGKNVTDIETLADTAQSVGLERREALSIIIEGRYLKPVLQLEQEWRSRGVQSVPTFVFDNKIVLEGAPGVAAFTEVINREVQS